MTETGGPHTMVEVPDTPLPPELRGSFGIPLPRVVQHRIVDPSSGVEAPAGHEGEIQVRGQIVMSGIYKQERHEVFCPDGWYATGDRGWFDDSGHLHFTGRATTLIKTTGSNVSPAEVESVLDSMAEVLHSFVVAVPHPVRGQVLAPPSCLPTGLGCRSRPSLPTLAATCRRSRFPPSFAWSKRTSYPCCPPAKSTAKDSCES